MPIEPVTEPYTRLQQSQKLARSSAQGLASQSRQGQRSVHAHRPGDQTEVPMPHSSNEDDSYASASASICSSAHHTTRTVSIGSSIRVALI